MLIIIREKNSFMPSTTIKINKKEITVEENNVLKQLNYNEGKIYEIFNTFLLVFKHWKSKYEEKKIIDEDVFEILVINNDVRKEYLIKNKYPNNWEKFMFLRNKLLREEL